MRVGEGGPLLLGVDAGTTNTKAVVVDAGGRLVAEATRPTPIAYPRPEWAEYAGEGLWQSAVEAIRGALAGLDDPARVRGAAFASMAETAVPLDEDGEATGPAIAWFDGRAREEMAVIVERVGERRLFDITGLAPTPIFGLCKLLWHKRHRPDAFARTRRWLNVADYLAWRLTGVMATDPSLACRTMAFDLGTLDWSRPILDAVEVAPGLMAPLAPSGRALGRITPAAAEATGLAADCIVAVGGHDHIVGALAADAMRPGVMLQSTGTTEAVMMALERPVGDPRLGEQGYAQGALVLEARSVYYLLGGLFTAGGSIEWFRRSMAGGADYATLVGEAEAAPPGSLGAGFLPQLRMGTPPRPDAHARGAFFGLSTDIDRGCLFRAVLEGIAADSRLCGDGMLALSRTSAPEAVRVIGGLTRNRLYLRIKAAMMGRPVTVVELADSVAMGAALLAGLGAGVFADLETALRAMRSEEEAVAPDPDEAVFYARLLDDVYRDAAPTLRPLHEAVRRCPWEGGGGVSEGPPR